MLTFQRLFRWEDERKTRFIESLLLGIPIPPIFVFQGENGVWELIDGLQRLSTVFQLSGDLKDADGQPVPHWVATPSSGFIEELEGLVEDAVSALRSNVSSVANFRSALSRYSCTSSPFWYAT